MSDRACVLNTTKHSSSTPPVVQTPTTSQALLQSDVDFLPDDYPMTSSTTKVELFSR